MINSNKCTHKVVLCVLRPYIWENKGWGGEGDSWYGVLVLYLLYCTSRAYRCVLEQRDMATNCTENVRENGYSYWDTLVQYWDTLVHYWYVRTYVFAELVGYEAAW